MNTFFIWAAADRARDYSEGDLVPDGAGVYLHAADTLEAARAAMVEDAAWYETASGDSAALFIAVSEDEAAPRIVSGPHAGSAWPMPYAPKRYRPEFSAFVSLAVVGGAV